MIKIGSVWYKTFEEFKQQFNLPKEWSYSLTINDFDTEEEFEHFNSWIIKYNEQLPIKAQ